MKKWFLGLFLIVASSMVFAGSQDELDLRLNLPKGFSASIAITSDFKSLNKDVPGLNKDFEEYNKTIEKFQIHCLEVDAESNMKIKQTWVSIKEIYRDISGKMCIRYDSEDSQYSVPEGAVFDKYLIGQHLIFKVNSKGKILDINGYEKIAKKMTKPALKHLHLGKDGIIRMLKNYKLFGISEFCSMGPVKVGELHTETAIPDIETIPKIVSYSKTWSLKEINDGLSHYEITVDSIKKQTWNITEFGKKRTSQEYKKSNEIRHLACDITTGLIIKSRYVIDSFSRDVHIGYDQSETIREYSGNGSMTIETVKNDPKVDEWSKRMNSIYIIGILAFAGIIFFCGNAIRKKNG